MQGVGYNWPTNPMYLIGTFKCCDYQPLANHRLSRRQRGAIIAAPSINFNYLQLDFNIHARRQVEFHQRVNRLVSWVDDVHQTQVGADFKLIAGRFVHVR